jgi:hypothetical protein
MDADLRAFCLLGEWARSQKMRRCVASRKFSVLCFHDFGSDVHTCRRKNSIRVLTGSALTK